MCDVPRQLAIARLPQTGTAQTTRTSPAVVRVRARVCLTWATTPTISIVSVHHADEPSADRITASEESPGQQLVNHGDLHRSAIVGEEQPRPCAAVMPIVRKYRARRRPLRRPAYGSDPEAGSPTMVNEHRYAAVAGQTRAGARGHDPGLRRELLDDARDERGLTLRRRIALQGAESISAVNTPSGRKPGSIRRKWSKLSTRRPAPVNRTRATATWSTTSPSCSRWCCAEPVPRPPSFNKSAKLPRDACQAGSTPKTNTVAIDVSAQNATTRPSMPIYWSSAEGTGGASARRIRTPATATPDAERAGSKAECRGFGQQLAHEAAARRAERGAHRQSAARAKHRTRKRLARLAAPISRHARGRGEQHDSAGLTSPTHWSSRGMVSTDQFSFVFGYASASRPRDRFHLGCARLRRHAGLQATIDREIVACRLLWSAPEAQPRPHSACPGSPAGITPTIVYG